MTQDTGTAPLQEFCGVIKPEGRVIVLNIVCGQELVHFFELDGTGLAGYRGSDRTAVYLSGVIDIKHCPFEILRKGIWMLLELCWRSWRLDGAIMVGESLA